LPARNAQLVLGLLLIGALGITSGCGTPARVAEPLAQTLAGDAPERQSEFWYQLARSPSVSNDDAFHALLLYFDGGDPAPDYAGRVALLRERRMLPDGFDRPGEEVVERGTIATAIARAAQITGGVTMQLIGVTPRYADRALQSRGLLTSGSPNQTVTGGQFVAILGRLEDYQRGNPNESPAALLPGEAAGAYAPGLSVPDDDPLVIDVLGRPLMLNVLSASANTWWQETPGGAATPATGPSTRPAPTPDQPVKLKVIITGVEGDLVEIRKSPAEPWVKARVGQSLTEGGEFRTGPRSAVRFVIPPDQVFTLDRQGTCSVLQAVFNGQKVNTEVGMDRGRVRLDVAPIAKPLPKTDDPDDAEPRYRYDPGGIEYGITIRSPNSALAVRGTLVSLYDEPGFTPEAVSLTGQAVFRNTRRQLIAFGGTAGRTLVRGSQSGAAENALEVATAPPTAEVTRNSFEALLTRMLIDRGGAVRGDVLVGNNRVTDATLVPRLPGALNFVLRWDGGPQRDLNDLNLAVFSPLHSAASPDFVGNPPFTLSLRPGDPAVEQTRASLYPRSSRTGGQISRNHIGPEGLEVASWGRSYPPGDYRLVVFNLLDAVPPPVTTQNPVPYTLDVFLNKRILVNTISGSLGELETSAPVVVPVPASGTPAAVASNRGVGPSRGGRVQDVAGPSALSPAQPPSLQRRRDRAR